MLNMLIQHFANGNKSRFANMLGVSPQAINTWMVRKTFNSELIFEKIPEISPRWLLSGNGNMLDIRDKSTVKTQVNNAISTNCECIDVETSELPIVPSDLVRVPNLDIYEVIHSRDDIPMQPVVRQFPPGDLFHRITTHSMEPSICAGDKLLLDAYPQGEERIIPGYPYVVDTRPNGFVTRLLYNHPNGYLARAYKPDIYPDFIIPHEDVIRIYRIVGLLRINVQ